MGHCWFLAHASCMSRQATKMIYWQPESRQKQLYKSHVYICQDSINYYQQDLLDMTPNKNGGGDEAKVLRGGEDGRVMEGSDVSREKAK